MSNKKEFLPFKEAREVVHRSGITTFREWYKMRIWKVGSLAIPSNPYRHYKNKGWVSWNDFLGVQKKAPYKSYWEAKEIVKTLGIKSSHEWITTKSHLRKNIGLPSGPHNYYKNKGWSGWGDFLGRDKNT